MKPSDFQKTVQCRFESCLKKVVRSVVKDYYKELNRRKNKEISLLVSKVKSSFQRSNANFDEVVTIETGETWGHLRVEEKIGSGGMGLVYQAYDNILDRQVAVKFLRMDGISKIHIL